MKGFIQLSFILFLSIKPATGQGTYYPDGDGDGYGAGDTILAWVQPGGSSLTNDDCDDGEMDINPGATEICNAGVDDDCDGLADDVDPSVTGQGTYYANGDGDGYGAGDAILACIQPGGSSLANDDCDDDNEDINPGATEICNAEVDDDCDGLADDADPSIAGQGTYYADGDADSYGAGDAILACIQPGGSSLTDDDCDDDNEDINPDATEICNAGLDDNCDGLADDADPTITLQGTYYADGDGDGYGTGDAIITCIQPGGSSLTNEDCDDDNEDINPGAIEICNAGVDDDCNGLADVADPPVTGQSIQNPNFLVVVIDDAEYNMLRPYVPEYVHQPGIDSIADQGATIRMDNVQSMCNPSRYSMLTGLYPHNHCATDNVTPVNPNFTLVTKVLGSNGYKVCINGKFTNTVNVTPPKIVKKWWIIKNHDYLDATFYKSKGKKYVMSENTTKVIHDTAEKWLSSLQPPFFIWLGEILPHRGPVATAVNKNMYKNHFIPLTPKFNPFTRDYPSYLYGPGAKFYSQVDSPALKASIRANYECFNDLSDFLLNAVDILRERGLLENTFIVIVGDNGFMNGEHMLYGKNKPYEESMRVPCFIRYAPWFTPGTVVDYTGFQSIDFAATILDAAGINDAAFNSQSMGKSLRHLMTPCNERKVQYFEAIRRSMSISDDDNDTILPSFRSVKTLSYKYIRYKCDSLTEELFDLETDPEETTNMAKDSQYESVLNMYRQILDSMAIVLNDTISGDTIIRDCNLVTVPPSEKQLNSTRAPEVSIFPNPADESLKLRIASPVASQDEIRFEIFNAIGQLFYAEKFPGSSLLEINIPTISFVSGLYFLGVKNGENRSLHPFVIEH